MWQCSVSARVLLETRNVLPNRIQNFVLLHQPARIPQQKQQDAKGRFGSTGTPASPLISRNSSSLTSNSPILKTKDLSSVTIPSPTFQRTVTTVFAHKTRLHSATPAEKSIQMSIKRMLVLAGLLCVSAPVVFSEAHCPGSSTSLPLRLIQNALFVTSISVNGTGPYDFLVDTGAQVNTIDAALATTLDLAAEKTVGVSGAATYSRNMIVRINITAGNRRVAASQTIVVPRNQLSGFDRSIRGILGGTFLEHFDFLLDNQNRLLCLDDTGALSASLKGQKIALADPLTQAQSPVPFHPSARHLRESLRLRKADDPHARLGKQQRISLPRSRPAATRGFEIQPYSQASRQRRRAGFCHLVSAGSPHRKNHPTPDSVHNSDEFRSAEK